MTLSSIDIDYLRGLVAKESGNVISPRQSYMLEKQLAPLAVEEGLDNIERMVNQLRRGYDNRLATRIAEAVTVNETSFFRDLHPFEALKNTIVPNLIKENAARKSLRIWCAASSSGQEPYSIAMTLHESFPSLRDWNVTIEATDISEEMVARTQAGEYSQLEVNRGLQVKKLVRYFDRNGTSWIAKPELRNWIKTKQLNLTNNWGFLQKFDIVFIRNVLIYFDKKDKIDILQKVARTMNPGGYLFIGSAEMIIGMDLPFEKEASDDSIYYRPSSSS